MADTSFPHLGWNPAPGSPAEIAALRSKLTASASALGTAYRLVDADPRPQADVRPSRLLEALL
ncbi:hypothetical protein ACF1G0_17670 [Streptomyces sp. NPDC013953]|uniref:hypothetical protein n=1 Tax=Streptomyces sp. NPDC013953 TaxID=3364868 RepID=UPI0036F5D1FB